MNIAELDQFSLDDAVKFHDRLNPRLWGKDEHLLPEVRQKLAAVAADFQEFLGVPDLDVEDITVSGSNAAYSYTPGSDIDLHLVVRMPTENSEVYQELFNAKKYQYNNEHDIRIGGADVELYVQPSDQPHHSLGIYSLKDQQWRQVPRRRKITLDDQCVQHKTQDLAARIDQAVTSGDKDHLQRLLDKIKVMRQTGLETTGEFGCDNLVFKMLRRSGHLDRLRQARTQAHDRELSLAERRKGRRRRVKYGFGGWFYPGYSNDSGADAGGGDGGGGGESMHESPDGVSPTTKMFFETQDAEDTVHDFIQHVAKQLQLQRMPEIQIHHDRKWSEHNHSFGRYEPETHQLHVSLAGRHIMDTLRTTAHELVHAKQNEIAQLPDDAGQTGSAWENQAHAVAGKIMRHWADKHPEHFVNESSGYIPTAAEKNDPRFQMALSADVQPGATGKNANKMRLKTDSQGRPGLLMKTVNLREGAARDLNDPPGPETPPTMPAGTVRVDVSDMYDWYKLGQHISNMKGLGRHDFGAGPPSTIFSFGDEDLEHQYIAALKKTGLDTTDIDPAAHDPKSGQKTDPTYNVNEQSGKKSAVYSTDVYGMTAYHSKCLEPGCDWQSRRYDSIKLAQNAAQKHAQKHFKQGVAEDVNTGPQIIYATGPRTMGVNDVDLVFKDLRTGRIVAHVVGNNYHPGDDRLQEFAPPEGGGDGDGDGNQPKTAKYEIRMNNSKQPTYLALGDPQQDSKHEVYKLVSGKTDGPTYYGMGMTLVSNLDWWNFLEKMLGEIMWEDDAIEAGLVDRKDNGDLVFLNKQQGVAEGDLVESLRREFELLESEVLGEIKMSPKNLRQEAAKTGAMAGMEFEMIVPNARGEPPEPDYEPDYDQDESVRDIDDAVQFFDDGDYNSRRDVVNLREEMEGQYYEWLDERKQEKWEEESADYIRDWLWRTYEDEWEEQAQDAVLADTPEFGVNDEEIRDKIDQMVRARHDEVTEDVLANLGSDYDEAYDEWSEDFNANTDMESEWLASAGIETMRDVERQFDIQWPHWYDSNAGSEGDTDINDVADEFSRMINKPVNASERYHGARREPGHYVVEPDGSLDPDNSEDAGLEFVSPPMPIDELLSDLNKIKKWAGTYGCYTNDSTGLHINISVPNYDVDQLDYVKLALLMGDEYVLKAFGRTGNIYTKSAMGKIKDVIRNKPQAAEALLAKMKGHMDDLATKAIHSGTTEKYTSINTKSGYIEFRSPGGDWLDDNFDKIESTLLRFTVALSAAMDPDAYRQEYLKKLYKLLTPDGDNDPIAYFARYAAGELDKSDLRKFIKQVQLQRNVVKGKQSGKMWWQVSRPGHFASIEVVAASKEEAIAKAIEPDNYPDWARARDSLQVKPLRPYVEPQSTSQPTGGNLSQTDIENRLGWGSQSADANYEIVYRASNPPQRRFVFIANTPQEAQRKYTDWLAAQGLPAETEDYGFREIARPGSTLDLQRQRAAAAQSTDTAQGGLIDVPIEIPDTAPRTLTTPGQPQLQFTGNWLILDPEGREIHRFGGVGNVQSDANRVAIQWLRAHPGTMQAGVTVAPEMA